jgi:putative membrane protein
MLSTRRYHSVLLAALAVVFVWSVMHPHDLFTWLLEALPVIIGLPILLVTYRRFPLSRLAYGLLLIHAVILLVGAHYTYAEMPLFSWLRDTYDLDRNYYDRLGHIAQGFIPAIVVREILLRQSPLQPGKWLGLIVLSICLAISALYEMLEWWVAVASGSDAVAFLATQGDVWDTQWDMFLCLLGAIASLILLSRWHDKSLQRLT